MLDRVYITSVLHTDTLHADTVHTDTVQRSDCDIDLDFICVCSLMRY